MSSMGEPMTDETAERIATALESIAAALTPIAQALGAMNVRETARGGSVLDRMPSGREESERIS
jgi:hypothetical protein